MVSQARAAGLSVILDMQQDSGHPHSTTSRTGMVRRATARVQDAALALSFDRLQGPDDAEC